MVGAGGLNSDATWARRPSSPPELTGFDMLLSAHARSLRPRSILVARIVTAVTIVAPTEPTRNDESTQKQRRSSKLVRQLSSASAAARSKSAISFSESSATRIFLMQYKTSGITRLNRSACAWEAFSSSVAAKRRALSSSIAANRLAKKSFGMFNLGLLVLDWIGPIIRCLSLKPRSDHHCDFEISSDSPPAP